MRGFLILILVLGVAACSRARLIEKVDQRNYEVGSVLTVNTGSAMIERAAYELWGSSRYVRGRMRKRLWIATGGFRHELLYSGKSKDTIKIAYREYHLNPSTKRKYFVNARSKDVTVKAFARPAFAQHVEYDLSSSSNIRFKNYSIRILNANNNTIKFMVLAD